MNNWRVALKDFYSHFMQAFPKDIVPEDVVFPWLTYDVNRGDFGETTTGTIHLHHHTESEAIPNEMADRICRELRYGFSVKCDEGKILIFTSNPEWFSEPDQTDRSHKHRIINVTYHWLLVE